MTNHELGRLLEEITTDVPEVDFAERAWLAAERRRARRRRRLAASVAAAAVVVVGGYALLEQDGDRPRHVTPVPAQTSTEPSISPTRWLTASDGTPYVVAPPLGREESLPWLDLGLPEQIEEALRRPFSEVTPELRSRPNAVYLEVAGDGPDGPTYRPVVVLGDRTLVAFDQLTLRAVSDADGNTHPPLGARAAAFGRLYFPQPGEVVVLDSGTGDVTRIPVPDQHLESVAAPGPRPLLARSAEHSWLIDLEKGTATEVAQESVLDGPFALVGRPGGVTLDWLEGGARVRTALAWPALEPWGDTVGLPSSAPGKDHVIGWVASGGFLGDAAGLGLAAHSAYQAVVAVRTTDMPVQHSPEMRALILGEDPPRTKGCCRVVGFYGGVGRERVLYVNESPNGTYLLAWEIQSGSVSRVTKLPSGDAVPGRIALVGPFISD
jgi:hypothetical protein